MDSGFRRNDGGAGVGGAAVVGITGKDAVSEALQSLEEAHRALVTTSAPPQMVMENLALKLGRL